MANGMTLGAMFRLQDNYTKVISKVISSTDRASSSINNASKAADKLGPSLGSAGSKGARGVDKLTGSLRKLASITAIVAGAIKGAQVSDTYMSTLARIDMMNDGLQTTVELQNEIMKSANRSRGSYTDMAASVAKLGLMSGDAFSSSSEIVSFMELVQKSFKVGGASATEQSAGMLQLSQAMASGRLQGDEFRSITENAPMIANAIADYLKVSKGELKEMSSDGIITADIIKSAMFAAADDIESKFSKMPLLWSDVWKLIKNGGIMAFDTIIEKVNALINTDSFMTLVNGIVVGMQIASVAIGGVIDGFIWLGDIVSSLWDIIWPILTGIAVAALPMVISSVATLASGLWSLVFPMLANVALWMTANLPIILLVASVMWLIMSLHEMGVTFEMVCGFVVGSLMTVAAYFGNIIIAMWNIVADFVNFFGNAFTHPIVSIKKLFYDLMVTVLDYISTIAKGIENLLNAIPGVEVNITSSLGNMRDKFAAKSSDIANESQLKEFVKKADFFDFGDAYSYGYNGGSKFGKWASDGISSLSGRFTRLGEVGSGMGSSSSDLFPDGIPVTNKPGKDLNVKMSSEDIKYLRDLAEKDYVAKFNNNTLAPNISVQFGDVHETADAEQVRGVVERILIEEIATVKEG